MSTMAIAMPSKPKVTPDAARATAPDIPAPSDIAKMMPSQPTKSPLPIVNQSAVLKFLTLYLCYRHLEANQCTPLRTIDTPPISAHMRYLRVRLLPRYLVGRWIWVHFFEAPPRDVLR